MAYYGYHRISTKEQHLDRGIIEIKRFCENQKIKLESIFTDKITGKNFDRPRYTVLVEDVLRVGDTLIITELDRLGRNKQEILKQLRFLEEKGVRVMVLELPTTLFDLSQMDSMHPWHRQRWRKRRSDKRKVWRQKGFGVNGMK